MVNIGSTSTGGKILATKGDLAKISLITPSCTDIGEKVALSRRIDKHWRLIGAVTYPPTVVVIGTLTDDCWILQDGAALSLVSRSTSRLRVKLRSHCSHMFVRSRYA